MDDNKREEQSISINDMEYFPVTKNVKESLRIQRTEYIRQQMRQRQEKEDALMVQLLQEQRIIDSLQEQIDENLDQTEESSRYNREFKESIDTQIYALHGLTSDKLEGMREYKNAYYQGCAFALFLLSAALVVLCGVLHGFQSEICIFMLAYTGIEGALLAQEKKRWKVIGWLCKLLYLLMFPVMMVMFVCFELGYPEYGIFMPYVTIAGVCVLLIATMSYFLYDPYRSAKKKVRDAKSHIQDIEKTARKEVVKNQKNRIKEEKKSRRSLRKENKRQERFIRREEKRFSIKRAFQKFLDKLKNIFHIQKKEQKAPFGDDPAAETQEEMYGAGSPGTAEAEDRAGSSSTAGAEDQAGNSGTAEDRAGSSSTAGAGRKLRDRNRALN